MLLRLCDVLGECPAFLGNALGFRGGQQLLVLRAVVDQEVERARVLLALAQDDDLIRRQALHQGPPLRRVVREVRGQGARGLLRSLRRLGSRGEARRTGSPRHSRNTAQDSESERERKTGTVKVVLRTRLRSSAEPPKDDSACVYGVHKNL